MTEIQDSPDECIGESDEFTILRPSMFRYAGVRVNLRSTGHLWMNRRAAEVFGLEAGMHVEVLFDKTGAAFCFRQGPRSDAFQVLKGDSNGVMLNFQGVLEHYEMSKPKAAKQLEVIRQGERDVIVF